MKLSDTHAKMKLLVAAFFLTFIFLFEEVKANLDLNEVGCGSLVDNYLLDNSSIAFDATSGDPGRPLISGDPWKPANISFQNSLTVDLGANYSVSQVVWSGDPAASQQTNQMTIKYSTDGITYDCRRKPLAPLSCRPYYGSFVPPVASQEINVVDLGTVVTARYFRFVPIEPDPGAKPGAHNLRIDVNGCVKANIDIDLVFLLSSTSTVTADANAAFAFMKNTAKEFVTQYGMTYVRYGLIAFGSTVNDVFNLNFTAHLTKANLKIAIDGAAIIAGTADLKTALANAKAMLQGPGSRPNARKIVVVMMDKGSAHPQNELEAAAKSLRDIEALVIGIGIGRQIPVNQLEWITLNRYYVMLFPWTGSFRHLCFGIAARCFKEFDITFAVGAGSANSAALFKLMKDTMGAIALKYGIRTIHYSIVTYGLGAALASVTHSFTATSLYSSSNLKNVIIDVLTQPSGSGTIATDAALNRCQSSFNDARVRRSAEKVVVLMTDKSSSISTATLRSLSYSLGASGLRIIPVGIGNDIDRRELLAMSSNSEDVIHVTNSETASALELKVMHNVYRLYMLNYDMTFIMYAFSSQSSSYYSYMQNIIQTIIRRYGYGRCRYTFIVYGGSSVMYYKFDSKAFPNVEFLLRAFSRIPRAIGGSPTNLSDAFQHAKTNFQSESRSDAWKVLVLMMDGKTGMNEATLRSMTTSLEEMGVFIIPVGMGRQIDIVEYYYFTAYRDFVTFSSDYTSISYLTISENIMNRVVRFEYVDMMFLINADSVNSVVTYTLMKNCMLTMIRRFGVYRFRYSVIIYGSSYTRHFEFSTTFPYRDALITIVNGLSKQSGSSGIIDAMGAANTTFSGLDVRSMRGLAIIMDKSSGQSVIDLQNAAKPLHENGVFIIAAGVAGQPTYQELRALTIYKSYVFQVSSSYFPYVLSNNFVSNVVNDGIQKADFVFAVSMSGSLDATTLLIRNTLRQIVLRYGIYRFRYSIIIYGNSQSVTFDFGSILQDKSTILNTIRVLARSDQAKTTNDKLAFDQARVIFTTRPTREEARKVFITMNDKPSANTQSELDTARRSLQDIGVTIINVGMGSGPNLDQLRQYTIFRKNVIYLPSLPVNSFDVARRIVEKVTRVPEIDMNFMVTFSDTATPKVRDLMKNATKYISDTYGPVKFRFSLVNVGPTPTRVFDFGVALPDKESVRKEVDKISPVSGNPSLKPALVEVEKLFNESSPRPNARKINVILTDRPFGDSLADIKTAMKPLDKLGVTNIAVGFGPKPSKWELTTITHAERAVVLLDEEKTTPAQAGDEVMKIILDDDAEDTFLTFGVAATTPENEEFIKDVLKAAVRRFGPDDVVKMNIIPFGPTASSPIMLDTSKFPNEEAILAAIDNITIPSGDPSIANLLDEVKKLHNESAADIPVDSNKEVVIVTDKKASDSPAAMETAVEEAKKAGIKINSAPLTAAAAADSKSLSEEEEPTVSLNPSNSPEAEAEEVMEEVVIANEPLQDFNEVGCGPLLDNYLLDITSASFRASSGTPGTPFLSGNPWIPSTADLSQNLTVDAGHVVRVSRFSFGGDPTKAKSPSQMEFYFSNDGVTFTCILNINRCKRYSSTVPPAVQGSHVSTVDLGKVVQARYFRFNPIEPDPSVQGAETASLRVELHGCITATPMMDIMFAMSATSPDATQVFTTMKNTAKNIVNLYGITNIKYSTVVFGSLPNFQNVFDFSTTFANKEAVTQAIDGTTRQTGTPSITDAFTNIKAIFDGKSRAGAIRVLVVMMDMSPSQVENVVKTAAADMRSGNVLVVTLGIGRQIPTQNLEWMTLNKYYVMMAPSNENPRHLCVGIMSRALKEIDLTFAVGANSAKKAATFALMKDTMKDIINKYGIKTIHYSVVNYGSSSGVIQKSYTDFLTTYSTTSSFSTDIGTIIPRSDAGTPSLNNALTKSRDSFNDPKVRPSADKIIVIMIDDDSTENMATIKTLADSIEKTGARIIPVGIGLEITRKQLMTITTNDYDVIHVEDSVTNTALQETIMNNVYRVYMPEVDLTYIINAASSSANAVFTYMQNTMRSITARYSVGRIRYSVIVVNGSTPSTVYKFGIVFPNKDVVFIALSKIKMDSVGGSALDKALELAKTNYESPDVRSFALKIVVLITDKRSGISEAALRGSFSSLQNAGVRVIPVGIGSEVDVLEMNYITAYKDQVVLMSPDKSYVYNGEEVMGRIVRIPEVDVVFVLNADSVSSDATFALMQNAAKMIGEKFGVSRFQYAVVVYGNTLTKAFNFTDNIPYRAALVEKIDSLAKIAGVSKLSDALTEAANVLNGSKARPNARKAIVIIQDKSTGSSVSALQNLAKPLFSDGIIVIASGIGSGVPKEELRALTIRNEDAISVGNNEPEGALGDKIVVRILEDGYPELDLLFAISLSAVNTNTQSLMKDIINSVIKRFGIYRIRYGVILFGNTVVTKFDFGSILPDQTSILNAVKALQKVDDSTNPNLKTAMETAEQLFRNGPVRENVRRVLVILIDKETSSSKTELETVKKSLQDQRVTIIPAAIGPNVDPDKLYNATVFRDHVTLVPVGSAPAEAAEEIIRKVPLPTIDLVFATTADSTTSTKTFDIMKQTVQAIGDKYGTRKVRVSLVNFGSPPVLVFDFNTTIPDKESLLKELANVTKLNSNPDLPAAIKMVDDIFDYSPVRTGSKKVLTIITHRKFDLGETVIRNAVKPLDDKGVRIVTVGLGSDPEESELTSLTRTERAVIRPVSNDEGKQVADEILKVILNDGIPEKHVTFAVSATGPQAAQKFPAMKENIKAIMRRYDPKKFKYSVVVFGANATTAIKFDPDKVNQDTLAGQLDSISAATGGPSLINALTHSEQLFKDAVFTGKTEKIIVLMWDTNSTENAADIKATAKNVSSSDIRIITVPMIPDPQSAADAANPGNEKVVPNTLQADPARVGEEIVDVILSVPCETNPCNNGGTCNQSACICKEGFSGTYCENVVSYDVGCGPLLDNYLLEITSSSFKATSGTPGTPLLSKSAWDPTVLNQPQHLTVDLGENVQVSRVGFGGNKAQPNSPSILNLQFSIDNTNYTCRKTGITCMKYFSTKPPPVPGTHVSYVEVNKGDVVNTRYIRYMPLEPDAALKLGGSSLRVEAYGCIDAYPEMDILFAISATSPTNASQNFDLMKKTAKDIVTLYGVHRIRYATMTFGATTTTVFDFTNSLVSKIYVSSKIDSASPLSGPVNMETALNQAKTIFDNANPLRPNARKVLVVMTDKDTTSAKANVETKVKELTDKEINVIGAGVGTEIDRSQLDWLTLNKFYVMHVANEERPRHFGQGIMTRAIKEFDITFVISSTSSKWTQIYPLMKQTLQDIAAKYGIKTIHYSIIIFGSKAASTPAKVVKTFTQFKTEYSDKASFANFLGTTLEDIPDGGTPNALDEALKLAEDGFSDPKVRRNADHVVVIITDKDTAKDMDLKPRVNTMENKGIRIIPVGVENEVTTKELQGLTSNDYDVIHVYEGVTKDVLRKRIMHKVYRLDMPDIDLTFIINAVAAESDATYTFIQKVIQSIIQRYNYGRIYYSFIFYGSVPTTKFDFGNQFPNKDVLLRAFSKLPKNDPGTSLDKALEEAKRIYQTNNVRSNSWKIVVILFDQRSGLTENVLKNASSPLREIGVRIIPVGIGSDVSYREMETITAFEDHPLTVTRSRNPVEIGEEIMRKFLGLPFVDVVFVINADSVNKDTTFQTMKNAIKQTTDKFGVDRFHYSIVVYGNTIKKEFDFDTKNPFEKELITNVDKVTIIPGSSKLIDGLKEAKTILDTNSKVRNISRKAIVVISDKSSGQTVPALEQAARPLHDQGIIVVASSIGGDPPREELRALTTRKDDVIQVTNSDTSGYLGDRIVARILKDGIPEIDIMFAISASLDKPNVTKLMEDIIKSIIFRYGNHRVRTSIIVFGPTPKTIFHFGYDFPSEKEILDRIGSLTPSETGTPNLQKALDGARKLFQEVPLRPNSRKVLVTIIDKRSDSTEEVLRKSTRELQNIGITQIPIVIGNDVPNEQIESITVFKDNVIKAPANTPPWEIGEEIISKIIGLPEIFLTFAITTEAAMDDKTYKLMTDTVKLTGDKYGIKKIHFSIVMFGNPPKTLFDFESTLADKETLAKEVDKLPKSDAPLNFDATMEEVEKVFDKTPIKPDSKKVLVVMTNKKIGANETVIKNALKPLDKKEIVPLVVGIGSAPSSEEMEEIARTDRKVIRPANDDGGRQVVDEIIKRIIGDGVPKTDIVFSISVSSVNITEVVDRIKAIIKNIVIRYSTTKIHFGFVIFGNTTSKRIDLSSDVPTKQELEATIDSVNATKGSLNITKVANTASEMLNGSKARKDANKVAVIMYDQTPDQEPEILNEATKRLEKEKILVIPVPFTPKDSKANSISTRSDHVVPAIGDADAVEEAEDIMDVVIKASCGVNPCLNGGTCVKNVGYTCNCLPGYYGRNCQIGCVHKELGVMVPGNDGKEHRRLSDSQITASSERDPSYAPHRGRLNMREIPPQYRSGWCANAPNDSAPHLQIDFELNTTFTTLKTKGIDDNTVGKSYVQSFYVSYANDTNGNWTEYQKDGRRHIFTSGISPTANNFTSFVKARYLRIHPVSWQGNPCMQTAVYGCDPRAMVGIPPVGGETAALNVPFDSPRGQLWAIPMIIFPLILGLSLLGLLLRFFPCGRGGGSGKGQQSLLQSWQNPPAFNPYNEVQTVSIEFGEENAPGAGGMHALTVMAPGGGGGGFGAGGAAGAFGAGAGGGAFGAGGAAGGAGGAGGAGAGGAGAGAGFGAGGGGGGGGGGGASYGYSYFESSQVSSSSMFQEMPLQAGMSEVDIAFDIEEGAGGGAGGAGAADVLLAGGGGGGGGGSFSSFEAMSSSTNVMGGGGGAGAGGMGGGGGAGGMGAGGGGMGASAGGMSAGGGGGGMAGEMGGVSAMSSGGGGMGAGAGSAEGAGGSNDVPIDFEDDDDDSNLFSESNRIFAFDRQYMPSSSKT